MKNILLLLLSCNILFSITTHNFYWNLSQGQRIESVKTADVEYYENGIRKKVYQERNIVDLTVIGITSKGGYRVYGVFKIFRKENRDSVFNLIEEYTTDFIIHTNGKYEVPSHYFMPNVRHIPTFLGSEVKVSDTWNSESLEIIKVNNAPNIVMSLLVNYSFVGVVTNSLGVSNAIIQYTTITDKDLVQAGLTKQTSYPERIYGFNYGTLLWDMEKNIPTAQEEKYQILFGYGKSLAYSSLQYKMNILSSYKIYDNISKEEEEKNKVLLANELSSENNITIETVDEGIVLRLGEILFDTDSYQLKSDSKDTIDTIIESIKKIYPDRELIIKGHTDNTGSSEYNQKLSQSRAKTVADYILPQLNHDKVSYIGLGDKEPIDSNSTSLGRQRNRRVDIIIKLR